MQACSGHLVTIRACTAGEGTLVLQPCVPQWRYPRLDFLHSRLSLALLFSGSVNRFRIYTLNGSRCQQECGQVLGVGIWVPYICLQVSDPWPNLQNWIICRKQYGVDTGVLCWIGTCTELCSWRTCRIGDGQISHTGIFMDGKNNIRFLL